MQPTLETLRRIHEATCPICQKEKKMSQTTQSPSDQNPNKEQPEPLIQFFGYAHLPSHLQEYSKPFSDLADWIIKTLPRNPERTVALRKLLEAKDCAVRAKLFK